VNRTAENAVRTVVSSPVAVAVEPILVLLISVDKVAFDIAVQFLAIEAFKLRTSILSETTGGVVDTIPESQ